ncbi:MAG: DUF5615 family PIN-like protein [Parvularculaceae bacterium]
MKLLFDENLARELVERLSDVFPGSQHVVPLGFERAGDNRIWEYAKADGFVIVSKDGDFNQLAFLHGPPPKVIWLRLGNCTTDIVERLIRQRRAQIAAFESDPSDGVLIIG